MRLSIVALLFVFSSLLYALEDIDRQQIQQRIQPVGKVHVQDQNGDAAVAEEEVAAKVETKVAGQDTYEQYCITCHRDGLAGAPKFHNENDWKPRLSGRTVDDLVASSIKGLNAMPAKGTCVECSEADLKAAIQYMLPKS